jgi:hypothetical protein
MHRTRKLFATTMIAAAGAVSAAVAFSASATAQPAPAPAPAPAPQIPGLPFLQQLATNPAAATQLMQGFTNTLGNTPAATAATTPATPVSGPGATASINLPADMLPAAPVPGAAALPGATPIGGGNVTTVPVANTVTTAPAAAPTSPLAGLTDQLGLGGLMPSGNPLAALLPTAATAPVAAAPVAAAPAAPLAVAPVFTPLSALP